jgi:hypothetical protein
MARRAVELEELRQKRKRRRLMQDTRSGVATKFKMQDDSADDKSTSTGTPEVPQLYGSHPDHAATPGTGTPTSTAHNSPNQSPVATDDENDTETVSFS